MRNTTSSNRLKLVGVAGREGRTVTALLAANVLETGGYRPGVMSALGYCDGVDHHPATRAIPGRTALATWLARMEANDCTHAVLEVSRRALTSGRLEGLEFDVLCGVDASCGEVLDQLSDDGMTVLCADAPDTPRLLRWVNGPAITTGIHRPAEVNAAVVERQLCEQTFLMHAGDITLPVRTRLIGDPSVQSCLLAAAVGTIYDIEPTTIVRGLEAVERVPGRMERLECGQPFGVVVDGARSPGALARRLQTLRGLTRGRLLCVFGSRGNENRLARAALGKAVESRADLAVVTSNDPRDEDPSEIAADVLRGVRRRGKFVTLDDRSEAIAWMLTKALPGDCVLIAGRGESDRPLGIDGPVHFDDREFACECLYAGAASRLRLKASA
jgi:UDP-N-acetylmuramoyl-L-alanyl-D-glutamate--2,6-diaminopimelate ligase